MFHFHAERLNKDSCLEDGDRRIYTIDTMYKIDN